MPNLHSVFFSILVSLMTFFFILRWMVKIKLKLTTLPRIFIDDAMSTWHDVHILGKVFELLYPGISSTARPIPG